MHPAIVDLDNVTVPPTSMPVPWLPSATMQPLPVWEKSAVAVTLRLIVPMPTSFMKLVGISASRSTVTSVPSIATWGAPANLAIWSGQIGFDHAVGGIGPRLVAGERLVLDVHRLVRRGAGERGGVDRLLHLAQGAVGQPHVDGAAGRDQQGHHGDGRDDRNAAALVGREVGEAVANWQAVFHR
jgi:hypothetical protein